MDANDTLERAVLLLEAAASGSGLSFAEAGRVLGGVAPSTLSRLLKKLCACGMLEHDTRGLYRPAPRLNELATALLHLQPAHDRLRPLVRELAIRTGQSAAYFEKAEGGAVLLAKHEIPDAFHYLAEGQINRNLGTQGFLRVLTAEPPPEVLVVEVDDNPLLRRVVAPVRLPDGGHGALGISFYAEHFPPGLQERYGVVCRDCAARAAQLLAQRAPGVTP